MQESRFKVGDKIKIYKPYHHEHDMFAIVSKVETIQEYGGPEYRGPHAYYPDKDGWSNGKGFTFGGPLPDAMVTEA